MALETCPWDPHDPGCDPYSEFIRYLQRNVERNADNAGVIDGYEGSGKSTLGMRVCVDSSSIQPPDIQWSPTTDLILNYQDWFTQIKWRVKKKTYLMDEGGNLALGQDSNMSENKLQNKVSMQMRQLNCTQIWCAPNKHWMTPYLREHRFRWWIHVEERAGQRGFATIMWKEYDWRRHETRWEDAGEIRFPDIPKGHPLLEGYEARKLGALSATVEGTDRPERTRRRRRRNTEETEGLLPLSP